MVSEPRCEVAARQGPDKDGGGGGGEAAVAHGGHLHRNRRVPLEADYHRTETLPGRCHLLQRLQKVFSRAEPTSSAGKRWRIETSRCIDTRSCFPLASVSLFKLGVQFPTAEREDIKRESKTEAALSVEKERKPLIFPPHFAINLVGKRPAADAQTADDVICNHGPLVSGRELLPLSTRGRATAAALSIQPRD